MQFSGFWFWKHEMDEHEMWPRMSKTLASRQLENRDEQPREPIRTTQAAQNKSEGRTFIPTSLRVDKTDTELF